MGPGAQDKRKNNASKQWIGYDSNVAEVDGSLHVFSDAAMSEEEENDGPRRVQEKHVLLDHVPQVRAMCKFSLKSKKPNIKCEHNRKFRDNMGCPRREAGVLHTRYDKTHMRCTLPEVKVNSNWKHACMVWRGVRISGMCMWTALLLT